MAACWNMNEWDTIKDMCKQRFVSSLVLFFITMIFTVVFDLTIAVNIGFIVAIVFFIIENGRVEMSIEDIDLGKFSPDLHSLDDAVVVHLNGPLYFISADRLSNELDEVLQHRIAIISLRGVPTIDATGLTIMEDYVDKAHAAGQNLTFAAVNKRVLAEFVRVGLYDKVGKDNFFTHSIESYLQQENHH
jgi:SulP family sulfate permease